MSEYRAVVKKFVNEGTWTTPDVDLLQDGQYQFLQNVTCVQEGAICARFGATRTAVPSLGDAIHTIDDFRIGNTAAEQYLYMGEGSDVYRAKLSDLATTTHIISDFQTWGERWTGVKYDAGGTGKPYFYLAGTKMYKDRAANDDGTATTTAQGWGIIPPPGALTAIPIVPSVPNHSKKVIFAGSATENWSGAESNTYKNIPGLPTAPINLGEFATGYPSGIAEDFYSNNDYIEITFTPTAPSKFSEIHLDFDVSTSAGTFFAFYQKTIIPSQLTAVINKTASTVDTLSERSSLASQGVLGNPTDTIAPVTDVTDPTIQDQNFQVQAITQDPAGVVGAPAEANPAPDTNQPITVKIAKNNFVSVGDANTAAHNWSNVTYVRVAAKSADASGGISFIVSNINLVGGSGPDSSAPASKLYKYLYTYRNDQTAFESNPCPNMVMQRFADPRRQPVLLTGMITSPDPQVSRIAVYRAGGTFADDLYRFVGYCTNTVAVTFTDTMADSDLVGQRTVEFDNDPPVSSGLKTAMSAVTTEPLVGDSYNTVTITVDSPPGVNANDFLTIGTRIVIQDSEKTETVQVVDVGNPTANEVLIICQLPHATGIRITASYVVNKPCYLGCYHDDCIFLAGDKENPHIVYKSKRGRPEAFPIVDLNTGSAGQIAVTSPSNPIYALTEFSGELVVMCLNNIYILRVFNGEIQTPMQTPASRGLLTPHAWCLADNQLVYLSKDGVYAWSGGESIKLSEPIDGFFKGITVNGIPPMNMDPASDSIKYASMEYYKNEIFLTVKDTTNPYGIRLRYNMIYKRWDFDTPGLLTSDVTWTAQHATPTTLYSARSFSPDSFIYIEEDTTTYRDDSTAFPCVVHSPYFNLGDPTLDKQWGDILTELTCTGNVVVKTYYNYASAADETLTINGAAGYHRLVALPIQNANAKQARTMSMRFEFDSAAAMQMTLHSVTFNVLPLANIQRGRAYDWTDGEYPYDKRLDQVWIDYDTSGATVVLNLDVITGINGSTQTDSIQTFTLNGAGRSQVTLPIFGTNVSMIIAKLMRLRPEASAANFKIFKHKFTFSEYPPDITTFTDPNDYGSPYDKYFDELLIDVDTGGVAADIAIFVDGSLSAAIVIPVTTNQFNRQQRLTISSGIIGKTVRMKFFPGTNGKFQLFSHNFTTTPYDKGPVKHSFDWDNGGWEWDKRYYSATFEYEVTADMPMVLEGASGLNGNFTYAEVTRFNLTTGGRKLQQFEFPVNSIYKMLRLKPLSGTPNLTGKIYGPPEYEFEKYPRDIVSFTESTSADMSSFDGMTSGKEGNPYDKYYQQLDLDVDTGGFSASVQVEVDGIVKQTITGIVTSQLNRNVNLTLNPGIQGKRSRILATPGGGGKFQLYRHSFFTVPADKGPVFHTYDWSDEGHPYDKRLQSVSIEYDVTQNTTMNMYLLVGITGNQQQIGPYTFQLSSAGRKLETFSFPDTFAFPQGTYNMIAKMVRFEPASDNVQFKAWKYTFNKIDMPMDVIRKTDWDNLGAKCEFLLRGLRIDADTNSQPVTVVVDVDGVQKGAYPVTMTTNAVDRVRFFSFDSNIIARNVRLLPSPPVGGKFQLFGYDFEKVDEPCPYLKWDSYEQNFGSEGYKFIKQIWFEYRCTSAVSFSIYTDDFQLLQTEILPAHTHRDVSRFFLYDVNNGILNKSKTYRFIINSVDGVNPIYMYRDASRVESINLSADQRKGYYQNYIWSKMPIPV